MPVSSPARFGAHHEWGKLREVVIGISPAEDFVIFHEPSQRWLLPEGDRLSRAGLWVDDTQVFDDTADGASQTQSGSAQLSAGRHQIRVRLQNRGEGGPRLYLYWTPPGGGRELVPGRVLYPPPPHS